MHKSSFLFFVIFFLFTGMATAQNGIVISRYSNGNIHSELSFVKDTFDGTSYWYHENGMLKEEKTFTQGKLNGWVREYYETGILKSEQYVSEGILDGIAKTFYENGGVKEIKRYEMGSLVGLERLDFDRTYHAPIASHRSGKRKNKNAIQFEEILCDAEVCPEPLGGFDQIMKNLVYPEPAELYGLEGTVTLIAAVDEIGRVTDVDVLQGMELGCTEAAIEAVTETRFAPGRNGDKIVASRVTIKVPFKLKSQPQITETSSVPVASQTGISSDSSASKDSAAFSKYFNCDLDICPQPGGGIEDILANLVLPSIAERENIRGEVLVDALVDEIGFVIDTKVVRGIGYGIDQAVESAILSTQFIPAKFYDQYVKIHVIVKVPIGQGR